MAKAVKNVRKTTGSKRKRPLTEAEQAKYPRISEAMKGNQRALVHGHASKAVRHADLPEMQHLKAVRLQEAADFVSDLGGATEITAAQRAAIESLMQLHNVRDYLTAHVLRDGILTQAGRTRAAVLTLLQVLDREERYLKLIGLQRVSKKVNQDLETFLSQRVPAPAPAQDADDEEDA